MNEIKVLDKGFVRLISSMGNDSFIVQAARQSVNKDIKDDEDTKRQINDLMRWNHTQPFEFVEFVFQMKLPLFCARQIIRHRCASVLELSGRYTTSLSEFYVPDEDAFTKTNPTTPAEKITLESAPNRDDYVEWALMPKDVVQDWKWEDVFKTQNHIANDEYEKLIKTGVRKELARLVLPLSMYTQWYWKMDLHNLFHFLELRLSDHAQWETQQYAKAVFELIKPIVPYSCAAFEEYRLNSIKFSKMELECLSKMLHLYKGFSGNNKPILNEFMVEETFSNKKEREEFLKKLNKIIHE